MTNYPNSASTYSRYAQQQKKEELDKLFQQQCAIASLEEAKKNTQLAEKNTKIAEENNEICKSALSKSIIANRLSFISIVIAIVSLVLLSVNNL